MKNDIVKILYTQKQIQQKILELGDRITKDYKNKNPILISLLKGAVVFMSDIMRSIDLKCEIDFMCVSSYGKNAIGSGNIKIIKDLDIDVCGKDIIIIEDILDSGLTLQHIMSILSQKKINSINICALLNKPSRRIIHMDVKYIGFDVPDEFIVGYGLDYNEKYRNLPYIGVLKREIYT